MTYTCLLPWESGREGRWRVMNLGLSTGQGHRKVLWALLRGRQIAGTPQSQGRNDSPVSSTWTKSWHSLRAPCPLKLSRWAGTGWCQELVPSAQSRVAQGPEMGLHGSPAPQCLTAPLCRPHTTPAGFRQWHWGPGAGCQPPVSGWAGWGRRITSAYTASMTGSSGCHMFCRTGASSGTAYRIHLTLAARVTIDRCQNLSFWASVSGGRFWASAKWSACVL